MTGTLPARLAGTWPVILGSASFAASGIAMTVIAARVLGPMDYTAYAAVLSVVGIVVGGPAAATEQALTRRVAATGDARTAVSGLRGWLLGFVLAAVVVAILPVGWQPVMFGPAVIIGTLALIVAAPLQQLSAAIRGLTMGLGNRLRFGLSQAAWAAASIVLPVTLLVAGMAPLTALIVGAVIAMAAPLVAVLGWGAGRSRARQDVIADAARAAPTSRGGGREAHFTALVLATLVMSACLLAVPAALRPHVGDIPAAQIAAAQIVIGTSRLAVVIVGFFQPLLLARTARRSTGPPVVGDQVTTQAVALAAALGVATVGLLTVVGGPILTALFGPAYPFSPTVLALGSVGVVGLGPALVLTSVATGAHRYRLVAAAWLTAGAALLATALIPTDRITVVLIGVLVSSLAPLVVLTAARAWRR